MKKILTGLLFIFAAVFLTGCLGSGQAGSPTATPTSAPTVAVQATVPANGQPTAQPTATAAAGGQSLEGKTYAELAALGLPVECDVTIPAQDQVPSMQYKMKMHGKNVRVTGTVEVAGIGPQDIDMIVTETMAYSKMPEAAAASCPWFKFPLDPTVTASPSQNPTGQFSQPNVQFSCLPGLFSDSIFVPDGNACTMEELYGNYPAS